MGFFDRAKQLFGLGDAEARDEPPALATGVPGATSRDRKDRPPLRDVPAAQGQSIEDALEARGAGDAGGARKILADIDRGKGLRTVLRAAAALEAGDEAEVASLLPSVTAEAAGWKLVLQLAAALGDPVAGSRYVDRAVAQKAPDWALAWTRATSVDETVRREGLVELLFVDAALARTVAARDLDAPGVLPGAEAATRYAAFAHGRDSIRRFDAKVVAKLIDRALGLRSP